MKKLLRPWVFVMVGILFNVGSAVVTHYFIGINNDNINQIQTNINNKQILIDSLWQSKTELERKNEFILLFLRYNDNDKNREEVIYRFITNHLSSTIKTYNLDNNKYQFDLTQSNSSQQILDINEAVQKQIISTINESYFEKIDLEQSKQPLEKDNTFLLTLAIFLQVTGLILVLARDVRFG